MPIALRCPRCRNTQFVNDDALDETVPCQGCGVTLRVPRASTEHLAATETPASTEASASIAPLPSFTPEPLRAEPAPGSNNPFADRVLPTSTKATESENPYQSPQTVDQFASARGVGRKFQGRDPRLASRWKRLGAAIVDSIIYALGLFATSIFLGGVLGADDGEIIFVVVCGSLLLVFVVNATLISLYGQTLGKMLLGIRIIVRDTEELPGFVRGVLLRGILPTIIGEIPTFGRIFGFVNVLFIFGEEKRCLHDLLAGTIVIDTSLEMLYRNQNSSAYDRILLR